MILAVKSNHPYIAMKSYIFLKQRVYFFVLKENAKYSSRQVYERQKTVISHLNDYSSSCSFICHVIKSSSEIISPKSTSWKPTEESERKDASSKSVREVSV